MASLRIRGAFDFAFARSARRLWLPLDVSIEAASANDRLADLLRDDLINHKQLNVYMRWETERPEAARLLNADTVHLPFYDNNFIADPANPPAVTRRRYAYVLTDEREPEPASEVERLATLYPPVPPSLTTHFAPLYDEATWPRVLPDPLPRLSELDRPPGTKRVLHVGFTHQYGTTLFGRRDDGNGRTELWSDAFTPWIDWPIVDPGTIACPDETLVANGDEDVALGEPTYRDLLAALDRRTADRITQILVGAGFPLPDGEVLSPDGIGFLPNSALWRLRFGRGEALNGTVYQLRSTEADDGFSLRVVREGRPLIGFDIEPPSQGQTGSELRLVVRGRFLRDPDAGGDQGPARERGTMTALRRLALTAQRTRRDLVEAEAIELWLDLLVFDRCLGTPANPDPTIPVRHPEPFRDKLESVLQTDVNGRSLPGLRVRLEGAKLAEFLDLLNREEDDEILLPILYRSQPVPVGTIASLVECRMVVRRNAAAVPSPATAYTIVMPKIGPSASGLEHLNFNTLSNPDQTEWERGFTVLSRQQVGVGSVADTELPPVDRAFRAYLDSLRELRTYLRPESDRTLKFQATVAALSCRDRALAPRGFTQEPGHRIRHGIVPFAFLPPLRHPALEEQTERFVMESVRVLAALHNLELKSFTEIASTEEWRAMLDRLDAQALNIAELRVAMAGTLQPISDPDAAGGASADNLSHALTKAWRPEGVATEASLTPPQRTALAAMCDDLRYYPQAKALLMHALTRFGPDGAEDGRVADGFHDLEIVKDITEEDVGDDRVAGLDIDRFDYTGAENFSVPQVLDEDTRLFVVPDFLDDKTYDNEFSVDEIDYRSGEEFLEAQSLSLVTVIRDAEARSILQQMPKEVSIRPSGQGGETVDATLAELFAIHGLAVEGWRIELQGNAPLGDRLAAFTADRGEILERQGLPNDPVQYDPGDPNNPNVAVDRIDAEWVLDPDTPTQQDRSVEYVLRTVRDQIPIDSILDDKDTPPPPDLAVFRRRKRPNPVFALRDDGLDLPIGRFPPSPKALIPLVARRLPTRPIVGLVDN